MDLQIRTAEELADPVLEARWAERRSLRRADPLRRIWRLFLDRGGPIPIDTLLPGGSPAARAATRAVLLDLDARDLVVLRDDRIELAYPFATGPNAYGVLFSDGRVRYACCAIDALGVSAMAGEAVTVRSRCHHCGTALEFTAGPAGPGPEAQGVMVWVGGWSEPRGKACTSL